MLAAASAVVCALLMFRWNALLRDIIDALSAGTAPPAGTLLPALSAMLLLGAANFLRGILSGRACAYMAHDLRMGYARHFARLPFARAEALNAGEQLSRLQNEITAVSAYLNDNLFFMADAALRFTATTLFLLTVSPALTLAVSAPSLLILAYTVVSSKRIGEATALSQQAKERMNRHADALLTLFPVIRLYDAAGFALNNIRQAVAVWEGHTIRAERRRALLMSLSALLSALPVALLLLVGGHMALSGAATVGTVYIFLNLSGNVSGVLMNMPGFIAGFRQFAANAKRLEGHVCL